MTASYSPSSFVFYWLLGIIWLLLFMVHELKLHPLPFEKIKNGTKLIESRLFDEKRQQIKLGDSILFKKHPDFTETIQTQVIGLLNYKTFADLMNDFSPAYFGWDTKENALKEILKFYTQEQQHKYTVLGIRLQVI